MINFDVILRDALANLYKEAEKYSIGVDLAKKDVAKLFTSCLILALCERVRSVRTSERNIIYINTGFPLIDHHEVSVVTNIVYKIFKTLPFTPLYHTTSMDSFLQCLSEQNTQCTILIDQASDLASRGFKGSFKKIFKYLDKNGLSYLYNSYFRDVSNKMLLSN